MLIFQDIITFPTVLELAHTGSQEYMVLLSGICEPVGNHY